VKAGEALLGPRPGECWGSYVEPTLVSTAAQAAESDIPLTAGVGLVAIAYAAWLSFESILLVREWARRQEGTFLDRGTWRATYGGCLAAVGIATVTGLWLPVVDLPGGEIRRLLGGTLALTGLALRAWAVLTLGAFFRVAVNINDAQHIVDSGPYRIVRHPSYTGLLVVVVGLAIGLGDAIGLLACLVIAPAALIYRIHIEEGALRQAMGDQYARYAYGRHKLVPGIW
jgi:protein-S-isoprenylcysteine O-methyltransferase